MQQNVDGKRWASNCGALQHQTNGQRRRAFSVEVLSGQGCNRKKQKALRYVFERLTRADVKSYLTETCQQGAVIQPRRWTRDRVCLQPHVKSMEMRGFFKEQGKPREDKTALVNRALSCPILGRTVSSLCPPSMLLDNLSRS